MKSKHIKKAGLIFSVFLLGVLVIPVLTAQLKETEKRDFSGKRLNELNFTEIKFKNEKQNLSLAGLLFFPPGEGPFPSVVIIHGSGTSQRDNMWYLTLADYLQKNGMLVLLPDKRGSEKSEGNWRSASFEDLATDVLAAVSFLKSQHNVENSKIGVIGMSQGGQIAPIAATECPDINFVVNIVGGALPMHEQFLYEEKNNLREIGFLPVVSNSLARLTTFYHINIGNNKHFWQAIGNYDAIDYWKKMNVEALIMYGENDTNTPSLESAKRLKSLDKSNIDVKIYNDSGHALEEPIHIGKSIFRKDALADIKDFISSQ
jgi:dienelactone hydrolase